MSEAKEVAFVPSLCGQALGCALMGRGLAFGDDGDPPSLDLESGLGASAWPIAGLTYLVMRTDTLRPGATCDHVRETVRFWRWFWTSPAVRTRAAELGFAVLPDAVRDVVLGRFLAEIKVWSALARCSGGLREGRGPVPPPLFG